MMKNNLQKGFTLLEALVAISILMVAVAAPITIAQKGLSSAVYSKDQMIAAYLAQDVIEYIKNKRDELSLNNEFNWNDLQGFELCLVVDKGCQIDTVKNSAEFSNDISVYSDQTPLQKDTDGFYQYSSGDKTKFTRQVIMEMKDVGEKSNESALVTVNIAWPVGNILKVQTMIYNY